MTTVAFDGIISSTTSGGDIHTATYSGTSYSRSVLDLRDLIMPHRFGELSRETFTTFKPVNL